MRAAVIDALGCVLGVIGGLAKVGVRGAGICDLWALGSSAEALGFRNYLVSEPSDTVVALATCLAVDTRHVPK